MKLFLLSLLFAASCLCAETDTNLYDRVFFLQPPIDGLRAVPEHPLSSEEQNKKWMDTFQTILGVQWPEGSELVKDDHERCNFFYVRNTQHNLNKLEEGLANFDSTEILRDPLEITLIAFHKEDIEHLQTTGSVTAENLLKLHKRGRSKILSSLKQLTKHGQEATIKDTQELIYPSTYSKDSSITNSGCESPVVLLPENFTMRELGTTCDIVLESTNNSDGLFILSTRLTYTTLKEWTSFEGPLATELGVNKETCAQPIFTCLSISGKRVIRPKEKVLVGGGTLDDDWVAYLFVTLDTPLSVNRNEIRSPKPLTKEVTK